MLSLIYTLCCRSFSYLDHTSACLKFLVVQARFPVSGQVFTDYKAKQRSLSSAIWARRSTPAGQQECLHSVRLSQHLKRQQNTDMKQLPARTAQIRFLSEFWLPPAQQCPIYGPESASENFTALTLSPSPRSSTNSTSSQCPCHRHQLSCRARTQQQKQQTTTPCRRQVQHREKLATKRCAFCVTAKKNLLRRI